VYLVEDKRGMARYNGKKAFEEVARDFRLRLGLPERSIPGLRYYFPEPEHIQGDDMAGENKLFNTKHWLKYLAVILIGNLLYFGLMPYLPAGARHRSFHVDAGTLVDLWFCLVVYGIFELVEFLWNRAKRR